jgi:multidrug efflux system membrane fusion protein
VQVTNRMAGVVERVAFNTGDTVKAGQVLVEIEPERFRIAVERARAGLAKAEAQVAEARASLTRRVDLGAQGSGLVPAEELAAWRSRLAQAEADAALAATGLAQAELDARYATVRAPLAAIIESRSVRIGQHLDVGAVVATQVQRLPMRLRARVSAAEAGVLAVGHAVRVLPAAGAPLAGRIVLVGATADPASRTVEVVAEISEAPPGVVAGGFAELLATASCPRPQPAVPQAALRATDRGYVAFVVERDGERQVARTRRVEAGLRSPDGWVEIRARPAARATLIVRGADGLRDGQEVAPQESAAPVPAASGGR